MKAHSVMRLETIEPDAVWEGYVVTRYLTFRTLNGQSLRVFDSEQVAADLMLGGNYEVILASGVARNSVSFTKQESELKDGFVKGVIVDVSWQPDIASYTTYDPHINRTGLLVSTNIGLLLLSRRTAEEEIGDAVKIGDLIEWKAFRLDLMAIVGSE